MRVLGALRQSKTREHALSIDAQRKAIQRWADTNGHEVIGFTIDPSTSGKLSCFKRPALGPYLTDPLCIGAWDVLVTFRIDRACRSTVNFLELMKWCDERGKLYVSLKENIDMSTAQGRQAARDAASRAEWERDMASERRLETIEELREQGRSIGGRVNYGMRTVKTPDGCFTEPDFKATARVARKMAFDAIGGMSNAAIRRWLNYEGLPSPAGKQWRTERVRMTLISPHMERLLSPGAYIALQEAMSARGQVRGQWSSGQHILLRVAFCARCSDPTAKVPLYGIKSNTRGDRYRCIKCHFSVSKAILEGRVIKELRARWGLRMHKIPVVTPGDDRAAEIKLLEHHLKVARSIPHVDTTKLENQIKELKASCKPDRVEWVSTGKPIAQHWEELETDAERNEFLRANHVLVWAAPKDGFLMEPTMDSAQADYQ